MDRVSGWASARPSKNRWNVVEILYSLGKWVNDLWAWYANWQQWFSNRNAGEKMDRLSINQALPHQFNEWIRFAYSFGRWANNPNEIWFILSTIEHFTKAINAWFEIRIDWYVFDILIGLNTFSKPKIEIILKFIPLIWKKFLGTHTIIMFDTQ